MPINSRKKGNSYELAVIKKFKESGWEDACSSRSESKKADDSGVDICFLPINVQCKAVEKLGSLHNIISSMPKDKPNVVFHKKNRQGTIVAVEEEFFFTLLECYTKLVLLKE